MRCGQHCRCSGCEESCGWTARYLERLRVNPTDSNVVSSYAAQLYQLVSWWMFVQVKVLESGWAAAAPQIVAVLFVAFVIARSSLRSTE